MAITKAREWFEQILPERLRREPGSTAQFEGTLLFELNGEEGGTWTVEGRGATLLVREGVAQAPDATVSMAASDFVRMMNGDLRAEAAFLMGKLKFKGDLKKAMKLRILLIS